MATDLRRRRMSGLSPETLRLLIIVGIVVAAGVLAFIALHVSRARTGVPGPEEDIPLNPLALVILIVGGKLTWTMTATVVFIGGALGAYAVWIVFMLVRPKKNTARVDSVQRFLSDKGDVASFSRASVTALAKKWLPEKMAEAYPGLRFGHVPHKPKKGLWSSWEDLYLIVFGPRMGKTTTQVIPAIFTAPGAVVTTSNKRDIIDDTIAVTSARGDVWVFDPQGIAHGFKQRRWFFDPLDMVRQDPLKMDTAAIALADIFRCAAYGDQGEDFWVVKGRDIVARMFLAAAVDNRPITDCFVWINDMDDRTPVGILADYPEWQAQAKALEADYAIVEETKSGLFSQGQQMAAPLGRRAIAEWITPAAGGYRFDPDRFVRSSRDTLYLLSKDGPDNAAALTTALTAAVMQAAERYGEECGGRLPVPLVAPLDEAANCVRWPELPKLYSHYGSRSIILMTILQSYAQGVGVWGEEGMEALWSAAALVMYGGGVRDENMLQKMEALIGEAAEINRSRSTSRDSTSTSTSYEEKKILTVAELASLEAGRAIVFGAKRRPVLAELEPFYERTFSKDIEEARKGARK